MASQILSLFLAFNILIRDVCSSTIRPPHSPHLVEELTPRQTIGGHNGGAYFPVLGVSGVGTSGVQPRLEIRQLEQNEDQFNVYLLGLNRFQQMNESDKLSYYQIAGIHGRPFIPWDGVQQASGGGGGYCTHDSNLFPPWHRPYLALFEEILYTIAQEAVAEFPAGALKDRYNTALSALRMPYWDWATAPPSGQDVLPSSLQRPTVQVVMANGTNTINNPLYAYKFHPLIHDDFYDSGVPQFAVWPTTIRDPSNSQADAASRNDLVAQQLNDIRGSMQSRIYHILTMETNYSDMSSDMSSDDSLEAIHDTIHSIVGNGGHMSEIPYAAFDPIFWLHHTMIDRCFAIWQALYPNSYVEPMSQTYATFAFPAGTTEDATSPLMPFHLDDSGGFWTSNSVRSTETFGYTYLELQKGNDSTALVAAINSLYGPSSFERKRQHRASNVLSPESRGLHSRAVTGAPSYSSGIQYITNIRVRKFGLSGSFSIFVFLGDKPASDPSYWSTDPSFVGVQGVFSAVTTDGSRQNLETNGAVELTAALEAKLTSGELHSLDEGVVGPYFMAHLHWRVRNMNNIEVPLDQVHGLKVSVLWSQVYPAPAADAFPRMVGGYHVLLNATDGRLGGFSAGDQL